MVKSPACRPVTALPFLSRTVTVTSTSLVPAWNTGADCCAHNAAVRVTARYRGRIGGIDGFYHLRAFSPFFHLRAASRGHRQAAPLAHGFRIFEKLRRRLVVGHRRLAFER